MVQKIFYTFLEEINSVKEKLDENQINNFKNIRKSVSDEFENMINHRRQS